MIKFDKIRPDDELASFWHGIPGVCGKIEEHLLHLGHVGHDGHRFCDEVQHKFYVLRKESPEEAVHAHDHGVDLYGLEVDHLLSAESQKTLGQVGSFLR